jgi:cell division protein FtsW
VGLFMIWLVLARHAALRASDRFGALLACGVGFLVVFQGALHMAVDLVVAPPTGVSLPFISYGGTSLLMMSAATSVMVSVTGYRRVAKVQEVRQPETRLKVVA